MTQWDEPPSITWPTSANSPIANDRFCTNGRSTKSNTEWQQCYTAVHETGQDSVLVQHHIDRTELAVHDRYGNVRCLRLISWRHRSRRRTDCISYTIRVRHWLRLFLRSAVFLCVSEITQGRHLDILDFSNGSLSSPLWCRRLPHL